MAERYEANFIAREYTIALIHMMKVKYWMTFNWTVDGMDLIGYTLWDCIDVFFSGTGEMKKRYGFIYVDIDDTEHGTMKRSKKKSFN